MNTRKKAIAQLRAWVIDGAKSGGYDQRCRLLAYGFVRGLPYEAIEQKTNEDKHCEVGRNTFYTWMAGEIAEYVCSAYEIEFSYGGPEQQEIKTWLFVRLNKLIREAA